MPFFSGFPSDSINWLSLAEHRDNNGWCSLVSLRMSIMGSPPFILISDTETNSDFTAGGSEARIGRKRCWDSDETPPVETTLPTDLLSWWASRAFSSRSYQWMSLTEHWLSIHWFPRHIQRPAQQGSGPGKKKHIFFEQATAFALHWLGRSKG